MKNLLIASVILAVFAASAQCEDASPKIKVLKISKTYKANIPVNITKVMSLPEGYHEGLFIEGDKLWLANGKEGNVWVIDLPSGRLVKEIESDKTFLETIFFAPDGTLWITDWDSKELCRVKPEGSKLISETQLSLSPSHPAGAVWAGDYLYIITWTRSVVGTKYHILKVDKNFNLTEKTRLSGIEEPSQITWDGKYLWISSWFSRRIYKIDPGSWKLCGYLRTGIDKTTGIYWDGKCFWFTGTKEGLYKAELAE